jgi:maltooligosyltrehalose trehalohydrolase
MHHELLRIRKSYLSLFDDAQLDGAILSPDAFCFRFIGSARGDLLAVMNLGEDQEILPSDPLLAPPADCRWRVIWNSEDLAWGGAGSGPPEDAGGRWCLTAESLVLLEAAPLRKSARLQ